MSNHRRDVPPVHMADGYVQTGGKHRSGRRLGTPTPPGYDHRGKRIKPRHPGALGIPDGGCPK